MKKAEILHISAHLIKERTVRKQRSENMATGCIHHLSLRVHAWASRCSVGHKLGMDMYPTYHEPAFKN